MLKKYCLEWTKFTLVNFMRQPEMVKDGYKKDNIKDDSTYKNYLNRSGSLSVCRTVRPAALVNFSKNNFTCISILSLTDV